MPDFKLFDQIPSGSETCGATIRVLVSEDGTHARLEKRGGYLMLDAAQIAPLAKTLEAADRLAANRRMAEFAKAKV